VPFSFFSAPRIAAPSTGKSWNPFAGAPIAFAVAFDAGDHLGDHYRIIVSVGATDRREVGQREHYALVPFLRSLAS
jgi:hypothetical protein